MNEYCNIVHILLYFCEIFRSHAISLNLGAKLMTSELYNWYTMALYATVQVKVYICCHFTNANKIVNQRSTLSKNLWATSKSNTNTNQDPSVRATYIRRQQKKFSPPRDLVPGICAPMDKIIIVKGILKKNCVTMWVVIGDLRIKTSGRVL